MATLFASINGGNEPTNGDGAVQVPTYILYPNIHRPNPRVVSAKGLYLTLEDGQVILDATGGPAVACLGHGNQEVQNAVMRQMEKFSFVHTLSYANDSAEDLARWVITSTDGVMAKATIMGSGSEAVEAAMKLTRQYFVDIKQPERIHFIARKGAFHGTTLGSLSLTEKIGIRSPFEPLLITEHVSFVSTPNMYRGIEAGESTKEYVARLVQEIQTEFERIGPSKVGAFVAETFTGSSLGCLEAPKGYFKAVRALCDEYGALLVLDEVMCGMGRTGSTHAWQQEGMSPDIQTVAKGLAGGYAPVSMLLMNQKIVSGLVAGGGFFNHGHTHGSHAVACSAALQVQKIIHRDQLLENVNLMGKRLELALRSTLKDHPYVGDIRGRGLFWAVEFVEDKVTKKAFPAKVGISRKIKLAGLKRSRGISLYPGSGTVDGFVGDHVIISPPFNVKSGEIDKIVVLLTQVIGDVFNDAEFHREKLC